MAKKVYKSKKTKEEKRAELKEIIDSMNQQIDYVTRTPENMVEYLKFMSTFRHYSLRNTLLIQRQFPGAKAVASFADFKKKGFFVKEKSKIKILYPSKSSSQFRNAEGEWTNVNEASPSEKSLIDQGKLEVVSGMTTFRKGDVFDISQTNAKAADLPIIFPNRWLEGEVKEYDSMIEGLEEYMGSLGVEYDQSINEIGAAKGYFVPSLNLVRLNERNTELQNVKTLIHELAHARLHKNSSYTRQEEEFQAELVAVSVCAKFGIDTTEYSLPYLKSWTDGTTLEERKKLLDEVYVASKEMIDTVEPVLMRNRNHEKTIITEAEMMKSKQEEGEKMNDVEKIKTIYKSFIRGEPLSSQDRTDLMRYDRNASEWDRMDVRLAALGELSLEGISNTNEHYERIEGTRGENKALLQVQEAEYRQFAERISLKQHMPEVNDSERKGPFEILFENMAKRYEKQATFEKEDTNLILNFKGKVIYFYDSENQEVTKSVVDMDGEWTKAVRSASLEDNVSINLFSDLMTQSGQLMTTAKSYGIDQDSIFSESDFIQLFKQGLSQKEQYMAIQGLRDDVYFEWVFSGEKGKNEIEKYQEMRNNQLKEQIRDGNSNYQNSEGVEFSIHKSMKEEGVEFALISDETGVKDKIRLNTPEEKESFLIKENVIACTEKSMEFTSKGIENHQSKSNAEQKNLVVEQAMRSKIQDTRSR